jgi:putative ABC transport system permease protein
MRSVLRDCLFGIRLLKRSPGFTATASATLAVGIASATTIFSVLYGTLFAPLPYRDGENVVAVWIRYDGQRVNADPKDFLLWKQHATVFADLQAWTWRPANIATPSQPERIQIGPATPGFLSMLGYGEPLLLGRAFTEADGVPGRDRVAILSHRLWKDHFGSDRTIIGKPVRLDGEPYTVVGVMRAGQSDDNLNRLWVPLTLPTQEQMWLLVGARLKPGVTLAQATAQLAALDRTRDDLKPDPRRTITVERFKQSFVADSTASALWLLFAGVTLLMLMACTNVANLLVARGTVRRRELAIRAAVGASSRAIVRQLLAESLLLCVCGAVLGLGLTSVLLRLVTVMLPPGLLPTEVDLRINFPVLAFSVVATLACALISGAIPAWQLTKGDVYEALIQDGRSTTSASHRLRSALTAAQCAVAVVLLSAGVTIIDHLRSLGRADLGFRSEDLLAFSLPVAPGRFKSSEQVESFYAELLGRLRSIARVRSLSVSAGVPARDMGLGAAFTVVGVPSENTFAAFNPVTRDYFATLGIPLRRGRAFDDNDRRGGARVAIVNETFVSRYLAGKDPLTQSIDVTSPGGGFGTGDVVRYRIIGVSADTRNFGPKIPPIEEILVPFAQHPRPQATIALRVAGSPDGLLRTAMAMVRAVDPDVPIDAPRTVAEAVQESLTAERFNAALFGAFGAVGLVLAILGLYGLLSFAVAQHTRDIGIRMALGATRLNVLVNAMRQGMTTAVAGTVVGLVGALAVQRALGAAITAQPPSPWLILTAVVLLLVTACVGCFVPARRAALLDPLVAMRD